MTSVLQFRRGNTAQNDAFTGAVAEISIDTSTNTLRVHNAVTPGGTFIMPTLRLTNAERLTTTAQVGQFIYVTDNVSAGVAPTWVGDGVTAGGVVAAGGVVSAASTASNLSAGTAGQIPYQTGPGATSFFGPGSAGQFLLSNGTSAPAFTNTLTYSNGSIRVDGTANATSTSTGALIVAGGIGVAGDVYVGGKIVSQQLEIQLTTVTTTLIQTDDVIKTSNTTAAHNATTGALQIAGGIGVGGSIFVAGNVTATTFFGNLTGTASTATAAATAYSTIGTHTAGTGLSGTTFNGSANVTWTLNTATLMQTAVNLNGGAAGSLPYQSAAGATTFLGIGTSGFVLTSNGSAPTWTALSGLSAGLATTASNIAGGLADQIPYQSAPGQTTFNAALRFNGTTFTTTNIVVSGTTNSLSNTSTQGALLVTGGAAIAKDLFVGGDINLQGNLYLKGAGLDQITGSTGTFDYVSIEGTGTGLTVADGVSIGGDTLITKTTAASSTNTGALQVRGGVGIAGGLVVATVVTATNFSGSLSGGTGGAIVYQSAANTTAFLSTSTTGNFLQGNFNGAPTWTSTGSMYVGSSVFAEDIRGGTNGQIVYQISAGNTGFVGPGTTGNLFISGGGGTPSFLATGAAGTFLGSAGSGSAPVWTTTATMYVQNSNVSTNLRGGVAGQLHYQTAADTSGYITTATTGNFLQANFNGAPTWTSTSSMYVNRATLADSATTATSAGTAYATIGTLTAGTGLTGTAFNGSANQTWTLNTATYMASAVTANNLAAGAAGSLPYQTSAGATTFLGIGTSGYVLTSNGTAPTWSALSGLSAGNATTATNLANGLAGQIPYQSGAGSTTFLGTATTGNFLQANFNGAPLWTSSGTMYVNSAVFAEDLYGGSSGQLVYQSNLNTTAFVTTATAGNFLQANGTNAPTWTTTASMHVGAAVTASKIVGGTDGQLVYQISTGVTGFAGPGTAGQLLVSGGTSAPTYTNTSSIYIQDANVSTNLRGGVAGQVHYQTGANTSGYISTATTGNFLQANFNGAPTWTTTANIYVANAAVSTNLRGGTPYQIPYQTAANTTAFANSGTSGQFWQATTNGAPVWTSTGSMYVNRAVNADNATLAISAQVADEVKTLSRSDNVNRYPTFVFGNNPSLSPEGLYTTGSFYVNAQSGLVNLNSLSVNNTAYSTSSGVSNALYVAGGAFINGGLTVATDAPVLFKGPVTFAGTATYAYSTNTVYTDNILNLHTPPGGVGTAWTLDDGKDIGFVFHYYKSVDKNGFLGLGNDSGYLEWYENGTESGGIFTGTNYGTFKTAAIKLVGGTANAGNTSTGDLTVLGGVGVGGSVYVGGNITVAGTINASITGISTTATNLAGGLAGQLPYQSAAGVTSFITTATTGNFLQANFNGAPTWTSTANIYVNRATLADSATAATTATSAGTAYATIGTLTAGTGLTGTAFNGSANQTWTLNTATYMGSAVTANNLAGGTPYQIPYQSAANTTLFASSGTTGQFWQATTNGAPVWTTTANIYVQNSVLSTHQRGGVGGQLQYQSAVDTTAFVSTATTGNFLQANFNGAPTWTTTANIYVANAVVSTNIRGGTNWQIPYQSAANTTAFANSGTSGQFWQATTNGAPVWTSTGSMYVGRAVIADSASGGSAQVNTVAQPTNFDYFLTFVDANNASAAAEFVYTTSSIYVNPSAGNLRVSGIVTATTFVGNVTGNLTGTASNATTATSAATAYATIGTHTAGTGLSGTTFNGSANVTWTLNTATYMASAVTANNLAGGSAGQFAFQTGAGATSFASTGSMYVGRAVIADSASGGSAQVNTVAQPLSADYFLTFVDTNNASAAAESVYTTSSIYVNPSAGNLRVSGIVTATTFVGNLTGNVTGNLTGTASTATAAGTAYATIAAHTAGAGLSGSTFNGSTAVTWTLNTATYMASAVTANNLAAGAAGSLPYQSAAGTTTFLGIGTSGFVLTSNGSAPTWTALSGLSAGTATTATNADNVRTVQQPVSATYYPAFVDSNNSTAAYEALYTTSSFRINASSGLVSIANTLTAIPNTNLTIRAPDYTNTFGDGQYLYLMAGQGSTANGIGNGGNTYLQGGLGGTSSGAGGSVNISGGLSYGGIGGAVNIQSGTGPYASGAINITVPSNNSGSTQPGGAVTLQSGSAASGSTNLAGGNIILSGGLGTGNAGGGKLVFHTYSPVASGTGNGTFVGSMFEVSNTGAVAFGGSSNYGSSGQILQSNGNASPTWVNASSVTAGAATQVRTTAQPVSGTYYPAFVDSNNASATAETVYTTSSFAINPGTGLVSITNTTSAVNTAGSHLTLAQPGTSGQTIIGFTFNGAPRASIRADSTNMVFNTQGGDYYFNNDFGSSSVIFRAVGTTFITGSASGSQIPSLGVGTAPSGTAGEIRATNEITAYYSDRRLKENVQVIDNAVTKVLSLNGITYTPNDLAASFGYDKNVKLVGLFADEVEAVLPEATRPAPFDQDEHGNSKSGENYKTIQYEKLVPLLIEAIKEQERTIQSLKSELDDIKKQLGK